MRPLVPTAVSILAALAVGGCGGAAAASHQALQTSSSNSASADPTGRLENAVRTALHENSRLSDYVLEHNAIPRWSSRSTAGPALAGLRSAAAQRRKAGVHVHVLASNVEVRSLSVDPSYLSASANVIDRSRVVVLSRKDRRLGKPRTLSEPARIELHRHGHNVAFVVWKVTATK